MNPGNFFIPNMSMYSTIPTIGRNTIANGGLFSKLSKFIKTFDIGGFLTNANKTINVVNQTIPLVKQAGPMFNNMKSVFKIAKAFNGETTTNSVNKVSNNKDISIINFENNTDTYNSQSGMPNFFI